MPSPDAKQCFRTHPVEGNKIVLMSAIEPPQEAFVSAGPKLVMQMLKESRSSDDRKLRALLRELGVKE